jgi:hypothetical protein
MLLPGPVITPDSIFFIRLADNMAQNHCYSVSEVHSAACVPSWGSQPPGYPLFLMLIRAFSENPLLVYVVHSLLFGAAATFALHAAFRFYKRPIILFASAGIIAISPLSLAWPRWFLTEPLASAAGLWVLGLLYRSALSGKALVFQMGAAVTIATLLRWDQIWLVVPVCIILILVSGIQKGLLRTVLISACACTPAIAMMVRAYMVGLSLLPSVVSDPALPPGVLAFWKVASLNEQATAGFLWRVWNKQYSTIADDFDYRSIRSDLPMERVRQLFKRVQDVPNGERLSAQIDGEFAEIAKITELSGTKTHLLLLLNRAKQMLFNRDVLMQSGWSGTQYAEAAETVSRFYRIALLLLCPILIVLGRGPVRLILLSVVGYLCLRTFFLVSLTELEIRYLSPVFPLMELALLSAIADLANRIRPAQLQTNYRPVHARLTLGC